MHTMLLIALAAVAMNVLAGVRTMPFAIPNLSGRLATVAKEDGGVRSRANLFSTAGPFGKREELGLRRLGERGMLPTRGAAATSKGGIKAKLAHHFSKAKDWLVDTFRRLKALYPKGPSFKTPSGNGDGDTDEMLMLKDVEPFKIMKLFTRLKEWVKRKGGPGEQAGIEMLDLDASGRVVKKYEVQDGLGSDL